MLVFNAFTRMMLRVGLVIYSRPNTFHGDLFHLSGSLEDLRAQFTGQFMTHDFLCTIIVEQQNDFRFTSFVVHNT